MYPQCTTESARSQHRHSYSPDKNHYYVLDNVKDYSSKLPAVAWSFENNDNFMEIPNRSHQDINLLKEPLYDNNRSLGEDIDFLLGNDSSLQSECCKHYNLYGNQQCCHYYERSRLPNHSNQSYNLDFNEGVNPEFTLRSINKNNSFNNNNDNNSFTNLRDRYRGDYAYQALPTMEGLQLKQ